MALGRAVGECAVVFPCALCAVCVYPSVLSARASLFFISACWTLKTKRGSLDYEPSQAARL